MNQDSQDHGEKAPPPYQDDGPTRVELRRMRAQWKLARALSRLQERHPELGFVTLPTRALYRVRIAATAGDVRFTAMLVYVREIDRVVVRPDFSGPMTGRVFMDVVVYGQNDDVLHFGGRRAR